MRAGDDDDAFSTLIRSEGRLRLGYLVIETDEGSIDVTKVRKERFTKEVFQWIFDWQFIWKGISMEVIGIIEFIHEYGINMNTG